VVPESLAGRGDLFPKGLYLEGWIPDNEVGVDLFYEKALEYGICLKKDEHLSFENEQICYSSGASVTIGFVSNNASEDKYYLSNIHF